MHEIPYIDIRDSNLVGLLRQDPAKAAKLINASRSSFGLASELACLIGFPLGDYLARNWLKKTQNPYFEEIKTFADILSIRGVFALNLCYSFACTSGVYKKDGGVTLARVLDWPFPAMGENIVVAHQKGQAGEFYNVTWPGVSGVFTGMAAGRFAISLNQAPMRRYATDIVTDWARNRVRVYKASGLPPEHLLRKTLETARDYEEAKAMLSTHEVSLPVLYTLSGTTFTQACVIERLENACAIREIGNNDNVCTANHFETWLNGIGKGWLPRTHDSYERVNQANAMKPLGMDFNWFTPPIANSLSRLVMTADAGSGKLSVMGTFGATPVTKVFNLQ